MVGRKVFFSGGGGGGHPRRKKKKTRKKRTKTHPPLSLSYPLFLTASFGPLEFSSVSFPSKHAPKQKQNKPKNAKQAGDYQWQSYAEVGARVEAVGSGAALLCGVNKGDRVGVYGTNSPEWMIAMQACNRQVSGYVFSCLGRRERERE